MTNLFENGKKRVANLKLRKLGWAIGGICLMAIQAYLPTLDFIPPTFLKYGTALIGLALIIQKGVEMFYDQTTSMIEKGEIDFDDTHRWTQQPPDNPPKPDA